MAMPDPLFSADKDQILTHLRRLFARCEEEYPDGLYELRCIHPGRKEGGRRAVDAQLFPATEEGFQQGTDWAVGMNEGEGFNVYVGVNPRKPNTFPGGAASEADVEIAFYHFADIDSEESVRILKTQRPQEYTFAVTTGRTPNPRPHIYWELDEPTRNLKAWRDQQSAIANHFKSDRVIDPPRIMRLAGSVNYPDQKKMERGYRTEVVTIRTEYDGEQRPPATAREMYAAYPANPESSERDTESVSGEFEFDGGFEGISVRDLIAKCKRGEEWHNNVIRLIAHWASRGLSDAEIIMLCRDLTLPGYSTADTDREVMQAIKGAREKWEFTPDEDLVGPLSIDQGEENEPDILCAADIRGPVPERDWLWDQWFPAGAVSMLFGQGGVGKTLLAHQLANCVATGQSFLGCDTQAMPVLAVLCEDDVLEIKRRQLAINNWLLVDEITGSGPDQLFIWPRVGRDNILVTFPAQGKDKAEQFYKKLVKKVEHIKEKTKSEGVFIILDTAADLFGGNENVRREVNTFIKTYLGSFCTHHNATILVLAHPSLSGLTSGTGLSGSTAWENSARARAYFSRPDEDDNSIRTLSRKKSNYSTSGNETDLTLIWDEGVYQIPTTPDQVDRLEKRTLKNTILDELECAYIDGAGYKKRDGRSYKSALGIQVNCSNTVAVKLVHQLENEGLIAYDKERGFKVLKRTTR